MFWNRYNTLYLVKKTNKNTPTCSITLSLRNNTIIFYIQQTEKKYNKNKKINLNQSSSAYTRPKRPAATSLKKTYKH